MAWVGGAGYHVPLCDHDVTLGDVDTSQTVPRRLEEHSQPVLQTCSVHAIAQHHLTSLAHSLLRPTPLIPAPPSLIPAPPLSSLPRLPSPLPLDVALQVLVGVSWDWAQSMELKGLCLRAPPSHCLQHLQGRGGEGRERGGEERRGKGEVGEGRGGEERGKRGRRGEGRGGRRGRRGEGRRGRRGRRGEGRGGRSTQGDDTREQVMS